MALSLLAGYSSNSEDSDSDDGINVIINKDGETKTKQNNKSCTFDRKRSRRPPPVIKKAKLASLTAKPESVLNNSRLGPDDEIIPNNTSNNQNGENNSSAIPLPSTLLTMFDKEDERVVDEPFLHNGRVRSFAHEKNNWASYVYIDASDLDLEEVKNLVCDELNLEPSTDSIHVSMSRTHSLRHHWIDPFIQSCTQGLKDVEKFTLKLDRLKAYRNDEGTRTFVGLEASIGVRQLKRITQVVDGVLKEYNLPPYYYPPSFHVSIGWCVGDRFEGITKKLPGLEMKLLDVIEDDDDFGKLFVRTVVCKSGNKFFDFQLK